MNEPQDWDIVWRWHWFRRSFWQPYFRDPTHPEGRPARSAPIWRWVLRQYGAQRVLDANCGLGLRALLLQADGFEVLGIDRSAVAVEHAGELACSLGTELPYRHASWRVPLGLPTDFDAIIDDSFCLIPHRNDLRQAAESYAGLLAPGGCFIFTGADQWTAPEQRIAQVDTTWQSMGRFQLLNDCEREETHLSVVVAHDRKDATIVDNYLFIVREANEARLEHAVLSNSSPWSWHDFAAVFHEAGFQTVESVKVPAGRREHIVNVARR